MKKGVYHALDALLAGLLIVGALMLILSNPFYEKKTEQKSFTSQDLMNSLSEMKVSELNHPFIQEEISNQSIQDPDVSVLGQIGTYWALEEPAKASFLFEIATQTLNFEGYGVRITLDNDEIHSTSSLQKTDVNVAKRMIAGIGKGLPLTGASSSAYLKKIRNKKTSSYYYYGGFIGQGNISTFIDDLPSDINSSQIASINLEGDFKGNFNFFINGQQCNATNSSATFIPSTPSTRVDSWNLDHCNESIAVGKNNFTINFTGDISESYVAGGILRVQYRTDELQQNLTYGTGKYNFPGITGIANIYDSFYVPGDLTDMSIALHFNSEQHTYLTIGERIIEINATGGDQWVHITNSELLNDYNLDYAQLSRNTVPLRFASYNATTQEVISGNADVIVITDYSGSMKKSILDWSQGNSGNVRDCQAIYSNNDIRRTHLARCLDKEVIEIVLNASFTGNRMWPVHFVSNVVYWYNNPEDGSALKGFYETYTGTFPQQGSGKTCLACSLSKAYEILETYSDLITAPDRSRFVILMSDGLPTHCTSAGCSGRSSTYGTQYCEGLCDVEGQNCNQFGNMCTDSSCAGPINNALLVAQQLKDDFNATIFTVGFGPVGTCSNATTLLENIALLTNGTYQHSSNPEELKLIYQNISQEILTRVTQVNQSVTVQGDLTPADLYGDSHINFTFNPLTSPFAPGKISTTVQQSLDNCTSDVNIPGDLQIIDSKVTSYSGTHWSDVLVVNEEEVFNLTSYYVPYYRLGDPLVIQIPVVNLTLGTNTIFVDTGDSPENRTGCSPDNSFIYTALIPAVTSRTDVKSLAEGCIWEVAYEDGDMQNISVPNNYGGSRTCTYKPGNISYNPDDTYDLAMYTLLEQLDLRGNGEVFVNINKLDLEISTTLVEDIPYLWGPAIVNIEVWQ